MLRLILCPCSCSDSLVAVLSVSVVGAEALLQVQAGVVRAVVAGAGGAVPAGAGRHRAGARQGRGVALRAQPVHHLDRLEHAPRVGPVRGKGS